MRSRFTKLSITAIAVGLICLASAPGVGASSTAPRSDLRADSRLIDAVKDGTATEVRSLIERHADVNVSEPDGSTPLAWAVEHDDFETVDLLLRAGAKVNAANDLGVTPLSLACENKNSGMVEKLLLAGADPNANLWTGETPIMTAARVGSVESVKSLLKHGANVNTADVRHGQTALMWAIAQRHPDVARVLIESGADVHAKSHMLAGLQPKVYSTYYGELDVTPRGGFTPLLFAAQQGDLDTARLLVSKGADVNEATQEDGNTLLLASANGHEDLALFLLEKGANPNATAGDGSSITPLHYALRDGMKSLMEGKGAGLFVDKVQAEQQSTTQKADKSPLPGPSMPRLMKSLVEHGANPNARIGSVPPARLRRGGRAYVSIAGATPYLLAAAANDIPAMRYLAEARAETKVSTVVDEKLIPVGVFSDNAEFEGSATPLLAAAGLGLSRGRRGDAAKKALETVKFLVENGADVNQVNETGWTPLHAAAFIGANAIIEYLVANGAKLDVQNGCSQTPLSLADGSSARGLVQIPVPRKNTMDLLHKLGAGSTPTSGPVGRCVEGRYGIDYFTDRDKNKGS